MQAVKDLRGEYDQLRDTAAQAGRAADINRRAEVTRYAMTIEDPLERRRFLAMRGELDQNYHLYAPNPAEGLPRQFEERAQPWTPYFHAASAASGGILPPEVFAVLAAKEGSMLADPDARQGLESVRGVMQFHPDTARRFGLRVGPDRDERLQPERAISAAGRYLGSLAQELGITGPITDMATLYRVLERYGTVARNQRLPPEWEQRFAQALQARSMDVGSAAQNLLRGDVGAATNYGTATEDAIANLAAQEEFALQQRRSSAILRMTVLGGGDLGRRLAQAGTVDPRVPYGPVEASRRIAGVMDAERQTMAVREESLAASTEGALGLADAFRRSRTEGEAFERHLANNQMIEGLRRLRDAFPAVRVEIDAMIKSLEQLNPKLDADAAARAAQNFWRGLRQEERAGQYMEAELGVGPFASSRRVGEARARVRARQISEDSDGKVSEEQAYQAVRATEVIREQYNELQRTRAEWERVKFASMDAFNTAIIRGGDLNDVVRGLGESLARLGLQMIERPLIRAGEEALDWVGDKVSSAGFSGLLSMLNPISWFGASGLVLTDGTPHRYAAAGMLIDRPTTFMAGGGRVTAGEISEEAIFPLKRDAQGNLGLRVAGAGSGTTVTVNAPITIQGGAVGRDGRMDPAAMAQLQNELAAALQHTVRQVLVNEQRDGGELSVG
jgi:hypothetical protein